MLMGYYDCRNKMVYVRNIFFFCTVIDILLLIAKTNPLTHSLTHSLTYCHLRLLSILCSECVSCSLGSQSEWVILYVKSSEGVEEWCWYVRKRKFISKRLKKRVKKFTSARLTFLLRRWRRVAVTFQPAEKKQKRLSGDEFFAWSVESLTSKLPKIRVQSYRGNGSVCWIVLRCRL